MKEEKIVPDEVVEAVAYEIMGTAINSLDSLFEDKGYEYMDLTYEQFDIIDNITFECAVCGWWCEAGDYGYSEDKEEVCSDCGEDEPDDEE